MQKTKVMFCIPSLGNGGAEKFLVDLAGGLDRDRFEATVVCLWQPENAINEKRMREQNIDVIYLHKKQGFDFNLIKEMRKVVKAVKPDTVSTHLNVLPYVIFSSIGIKNKYHTVHNLASREIGGKYRYFVWLAYYVFGYTPVAISDTVKKSIEHDYKLRAEKIETIYNFVETDKYFVKERRLKNTFDLVSFGRLTEQKNQKMMIRAVSTLVERYPNIRLHIYGDGELKQELQSFIGELKLERNVILEGITDEVAKKLGESDIFLLSSLYEGLPISVLEAMSAGLPVVSTKAGGVVDVIKDDENGFLIEQGDIGGFANAVEKLITDKNLYNKMSENSIKLSKKYDKSECIKQYEALFAKKNITSETAKNS